MTQSIVIIGNGGWGTAIAIALAGKDLAVTIWGHDATHLAECERERENRRFLPDVKIPKDVRFEHDPIKPVKDATLIVSAIPTRYLRSTIKRFKGAFDPNTPIVSVTKGIENDTLELPSAIIAYETDARTVAVLSGPTMAEEVARGLPSSATIACENIDVARAIQETMSTDSFRIYASDDRVGVELGGAAKNVIAIVAGLCDGMKLGDNAKAALLARGLAELRRLGAAKGARDETFAGLSGVGDLYTSCASPYGRNRGFGERVGKGMTPAKAIEASGGMIVEGVDTAKSIHQLAQRQGVEMPICEAVYRIVYENLLPAEALRRLLERGLRTEW